MPDPLIIEIRGNNAPWRTAIAEGKKYARDLANEQSAQAKRAADSTRAATQQEMQYRSRVAKAAIKDFDTISKEAMKSGAIARREAERAAATAERELKRQTDAAAREAKKAADATAREARRSADVQKREADRAAAANFVSLGKVQVAAIKFGDRVRSDAKKTAEEQIRLADKIAETGFAGAAGMGQIAAGAVAAVGALNLLRQAAAGVDQAIKDAADSSRRLAGGAVDQRDRQRELAATLGVANDNRFLGQNAQFGVDTAMRPGEVLDFRTQLAGSGIQFRGKNIGEAEYQEYEKRVAALGAARGLDAGTAGDFAGGVLGLKDFTKFGNMADEEAAATANRQLAILSEGRGDIATLSRQQAKVNSALVNEDALRGSVQSPEEAAALVSVAAEKSPMDASETVRASLRAVQQYKDKKAGPLLAQAGIKSGQSPIEKFRLLEPIVMDLAKKSGKTVNEVLRDDFGYSELEVEGVSVMLNRGVQGGLFQKRADIAARLGGTKPTQDTVDEFMGSETGRSRVAEAQVNRAEVARGMENTRIDTVRKQALAQLIQNKEIDATIPNIVGFLQGSIPFANIDDARQQQISNAARHSINRRAQEAGVDGIDAGFMGFGHYTAEGRDEAMNRALDRIAGSGKNPLDMSVLERKLEDSNELLKQIRDQGKQGVPPVLGQAVPAGGMRRP